MPMIEEVIRSYYANLACLNLDAWRETLADEAIIFDPVGKPAFQPKEDSLKFFELLAKFYERFEVSVDNIFPAGKQAAVKWTMKVTAKNGREARVEGIGIFTLNNSGKIERMESFWNEAQMKAELMG